MKRALRIVLIGLAILWSLFMLTAVASSIALTAWDMFDAGGWWLLLLALVGPTLFAVLILGSIIEWFRGRRWPWEREPEVESWDESVYFSARSAQPGSFKHLSEVQAEIREGEGSEK
jgi:hypothetical protein